MLRKIILFYNGIRIEYTFGDSFFIYWNELFTVEKIRISFVAYNVCFLIEII